MNDPAATGPSPVELHEQGRQLLTIWEAGHEVSFLDAAVTVLDRALALPWKVPGQLAACQADLLRALLQRIDVRFDPADRDRVISVLDRLIAFKDRPFMRQTRGPLLMERYSRTGSAADLETAVEDFSQAFAEIARLKSNDIHRVGLNLSWARERRFELRGGRGGGTQIVWDADNGVELLRGPPDLVVPIYLLQGLLKQDGRPEVPRTGPPPPDVAPRLKRNLANLLNKYADATSLTRAPEDRARDRSQAVELLLQALDEMPEESDDYVSVVGSLLGAVQDAPPPALWDRLTAALERSIAATSVPALAASGTMNLAFIRSQQGRIDEAVELYRELCAAGRATPAPVAPEPARPQPSVAPVSLQAAEAWARYALKRGAWDEAVEAGACATALTAALRADQPDWRARYAWSGASGGIATMAAFALAQLGRPAEAAATLQVGRTLMLTERLNSGPPGRLGPNLGEELPGTAVYLLSLTAGSLALRRDDGGTWSVVPLPGLARGLGERVDRYLEALDAYRSHRQLAEATWKTELERMLGFLRDALDPLVRTLRPGDVIVVPIGILALLPLGAALLDGPSSRGVSVLPALSLRPMPGPDGPDNALVIADPSLRWAKWEQAAVSAFFTRPVSIPGVPSASDAPSASDVMAAFPRQGVAHFACHGTVDLSSPLNSQLKLPGGGQLTVADVLQGQLPPLALVMLSGCETGLPDPHSLDEGIGFPAAFLAAANAEVVSTLWRVSDRSTALLTLRFYWEWRRENTPGPRALARAQWWQRSTTAAEKCAFIEQATAAGVLTAPAAEAMTTEIGRLAASPRDNPFGHPHYWAAFSYAGAIGAERTGS